MSAPVARTDSGSIALTVPAVPTGMKAGVRIAPRGVSITPVRARPSTACTRKPKVPVMPAPCAFGGLDRPIAGNAKPSWRDPAALDPGGRVSYIIGQEHSGTTADAHRDHPSGRGRAPH